MKLTLYTNSKLLWNKSLVLETTVYIVLKKVYQFLTAASTGNGFLSRARVISRARAILSAVR